MFELAGTHNQFIVIHCCVIAVMFVSCAEIVVEGSEVFGVISALRRKVVFSCVVRSTHIELIVIWLFEICDQGIDVTKTQLLVEGLKYRRWSLEIYVELNEIFQLNVIFQTIIGWLTFVTNWLISIFVAQKGTLGLESCWPTTFRIGAIIAKFWTGFTVLSVGDTNGFTQISCQKEDTETDSVRKLSSEKIIFFILVN